MKPRTWKTAKVKTVGNDLVDSTDIDRLLFFALLRIYPDKSETEVVNMLDRAREALSKL